MFFLIVFCGNENLFCHSGSVSVNAYSAWCLLKVIACNNFVEGATLGIVGIVKDFSGILFDDFYDTFSVRVGIEGDDVAMYVFIVVRAYID